jgi:hypothetical protein
MLAGAFPVHCNFVVIHSNKTFMKRRISGAKDEDVPFLQEEPAEISSTQSPKERELQQRITRGQIQWLFDHCKKEMFYMTIAFIGIFVASGTIN